MSDFIVKDNANLWVAGDIGYDFSAEYFMQELLYLDGAGQEINVHFYSGGGNALSALAIYDFVKSNGIEYNAYMYGITGSAATIIACAAKKAYIGENSFYFVHYAFYAGENTSEEQSKSVESINKRFIDIYKAKTGLSKPEIKSLMSQGDKGRYLDSDEAKQYGFADDKIKENKIAASMPELFKNKIQKDMDKNVEKNVADKIFANVMALFKTEKDKELSDEIKAKIDEEVGKVKAQVDAKSKEIEDQLNGLVKEKDEEILAQSKEIEELKTQIDAKNASSAAPNFSPNAEDPNRGSDDGTSESDLILGSLTEVQKRMLDKKEHKSKK